MQRLLLEVQAEKERLIRSLAAGSVENIITSSDECQNNGSVSNYTSPNSLNLNQLDSSFNPPSSIVHRNGSKCAGVKFLVLFRTKIARQKTPPLNLGRSQFLTLVPLPLR